MPEERISPKVIFCGQARHGRPPKDILATARVVNGRRAAVGGWRTVEEGRNEKIVSRRQRGLESRRQHRTGQLGKQTRQFGEGEGFQGYGNVKDAVIIGWEIALEAARQLTAPDAPSRLNCVFCTEDIESAKAFRDRFRNGESIYEVEVEDTVSTHAGNFDALTYPLQGAFVDTSVATAKSYWTDAPTGIREILVGGNVKISMKIE